MGQHHHVGLLEQAGSGQVVVVIARRVHRHVVAVVGYRKGLQPEVSVELLDHPVAVSGGQADLLGPGEPLFDLIGLEPDTSASLASSPGG